MRRGHVKILPFVLLTLLIGVCSGAFAGGRGFTNASLNGTYYIPCACSGTCVDANLCGAYIGHPIHVAGTGKAHFDGDGVVTLTQYDVYVEVAGTSQQIVDHGISPEGPAECQGSYTVGNEGFGFIDWDEPCDDRNPTSLLITGARGRKATLVRLIIPNGIPGVLIHVDAEKRGNFSFDDD